MRHERRENWAQTVPRLYVFNDHFCSRSTARIYLVRKKKKFDRIRRIRWRGIKKREKKIKGDRGRSRKFLSIKPSLFLGARRLKSFRVKGAKNGGLSSPLFGLRDRGREGRERRGVSGARGKEREKASKEGTKTPVN